MIFINYCNVSTFCLNTETVLMNKLFSLEDSIKNPVYFLENEKNSLKIIKKIVQNI